MDIDNTVVAVPQTETIEKFDAPSHLDDNRSRGHFSRSVSVAVIDPCDRFRRCIAGVISASGKFTVEEYSSADEIFTRRKSPVPCVVVFCSRAEKPLATLSEISELSKWNTSWHVVVLADTKDHYLRADLLRIGVKAVIPPSYPVSVVTEVLQTVLAGGVFAPFEDLPAGRRNNLRPLMPGSGRLTNREVQIVSLLRSGKPNKQIAYELGLSIGTVKVHMHNIMLKLGAHNRIQVLAYQGLIAAPQPAVSPPAAPGVADTGSIAYLIHAATAGADLPA